jgi:serine/threonine protein kinase
MRVAVDVKEHDLKENSNTNHIAIGKSKALESTETYIAVRESKSNSHRNSEHSCGSSLPLFSSVKRSHAPVINEPICLSDGTFSQVYKDTHRDGQVTVRKQLRNDFSWFHDLEKRSAQLQISNEINQLRAIDNAYNGDERSRKYIVSMCDWDEAEQPQYIRFPFLPKAVDLIDFYTSPEGRQLLPSYRYKLGLMYQLARGLDFLYRMRIAHRDIKFDNILISSFGHESDGLVSPLLQICDFGFAHSFDAKDQFKRKCGTRGYQSWELLNNGKSHEKSDVFSMGIVFFQMMSHEVFIDIPENRFEYKAAFNKQHQKHVDDLNNHVYDSEWKDLPSLMVGMLQADVNTRIMPSKVLKYIIKHLKNIQQSRKHGREHNEAANTIKPKGN